jgi:Cysteine rich repeat
MTWNRMMLKFTLSFLIFGGFPATATNAENLMEQCVSEINSFCDTVVNGRGRITACLYAREDQLSKSCRKEIVRITSDTAMSSDEGVPGESKGTANVRSACISDIERYCANIVSGDRRMLACLYSKQDAVSSNCSGAMDDILSVLF